MGLSEQDFWRLTLAQIKALITRYEQRREREDFRAGLAAAVVVNALSDGKDKKPVQPLDFFQLAEQPKPVPPSDMIALVERMNASFGGKALRAKGR